MCIHSNPTNHSQYISNIYLRFHKIMKHSLQNLKKNREEICPWYYMHSDTCLVYLSTLYDVARRDGLTLSMSIQFA